MLLGLLRHAETAWTADGRIQGRLDVPLSAEGRAAVASFRLPERCRGMRVVTSPLSRCTETAALIGAANAPREPRLLEMDWGAWQGLVLADLRAELGDAMRENENRGWDFRPSEGESPREVFSRVRSWLRELSAPTLAITHRGVIRAIYATAAGWDMRGPPPVKLDWRAVHLFRVDAVGTPQIEALNVR
jgi:probable phosphoglycerate mutase